LTDFPDLTDLPSEPLLVAAAGNFDDEENLFESLVPPTPSKKEAETEGDDADEEGGEDETIPELLPDKPDAAEPISELLPPRPDDE
jgi:hypothetical protein